MSENGTSPILELKGISKRFGALQALTQVDFRAIPGEVMALVEEFNPDLIMISAGFDSLAGDPLGAFTLEYEHFEELTRHIVDRASAWCGGRVVSVLEGGYDLEGLAESAGLHICRLMKG